MNALLVSLGVIFTLGTVLLFAVGARRLLGLRFSAVRLFISGLIAVLLASPIINAMVGANGLRTRRSVFPGLWFVLLGVVIALLIGMAFLVVAEALAPSGSLPGPVYLLRGARGRIRRTRRYGQISRVLFRHGLWPYLRGGRRAELATPEGRSRLARSLRDALDDGGVTFVKLGQVLSTRRDLLPSEFAAALATLQERVSPVAWSQVEQIVHEELGGFGAFDTFEQRPLAAASIAQVHAATLRTGERVVVKVRRAGVEAQVASDLDILARLADRLQRSTRWGRAIGTVALAEGFAAALREELDLRLEVRNLVSIAAVAREEGDRGTVRVPGVHESLSTERVLVMERFDPVPLPEDPQQRQQIARRLLDFLLAQVLVHGVFHADPHPGNVLYLADGTIGLLDFGSVGRVDAGLRGNLQRLLLAVDRGDPMALSDALLDIVEAPDDLDEPRLERALGRFLARHIAPGVTPDVGMFRDLFRIVADHRLAVPPEVAAVFRCLGTAEGTLTTIRPGFDTVAESRRFAAHHLVEQFRSEAIRRTAGQELMALLPVLRRLPRRLDRITAALGEGRLSVRVSLLSGSADRQVITALLHQILITFLAATTGIMAVIMLGLHGGPQLTQQVSMFQFFGYCLLIISCILGLRVLAGVFRPSRQ